ncbi:hypothetical protein ATANTOWER_009848 [Ataeniobius toweri]|uniref:Uncharacterized protein n=1 Tax=Ataeniobius toweri TaxID=208326 RepID=A0ABU7C8K8_9TELE|nr:hypothetical protein [Ataeniobius toweri]
MHVEENEECFCSVYLLDQIPALVWMNSMFVLLEQAADVDNPSGILFLSSIVLKSVFQENRSSILLQIMTIVAVVHLLFVFLFCFVEMLLFLSVRALFLFQMLQVFLSLLMSMTVMLSGDNCSPLSPTSGFSL